MRLCVWYTCISYLPVCVALAASQSRCLIVVYLSCGSDIIIILIAFSTSHGLSLLCLTHSLATVVCDCELRFV